MQAFDFFVSFVFFVDQMRFLGSWVARQSGFSPLL